MLIETTDNHPFWVEGRGWVFADELKAGDKLQKADGSHLTIDKVEFVLLDEPVMVYNFTVADYHTYYVTDLGIWVHNTNCGAKDFKNYSAKEIERKYNLKSGAFHQVKQEILKDLTNKNSPYKNSMKKVGNNPDIHLSSDGTIRIVPRKEGTSFVTNWNIKGFLP